MQVEEGNPLTEVQKQNIRSGFTDDLALIVLSRNKQHQAKLNSCQAPLDLANDSFNLKEYIDGNFPGAPIVVDLWNTWCGPCKNAINLCENIIYEYKNSGIVFLYVSDESSPMQTWKNEAAEIGQNQVRISREDMNKLLTENDLVGFPSYLFFDADHNIVSSFASFPGERTYRQLLTRLCGYINILIMLEVECLLLCLV